MDSSASSESPETMFANTLVNKYQQGQMSLREVLEAREEREKKVRDTFYEKWSRRAKHYPIRLSVFALEPTPDPDSALERSFDRLVSDNGTSSIVSGNNITGQGQESSSGIIGTVFNTLFETLAANAYMQTGTRPPVAVSRSPANRLRRLTTEEAHRLSNTVVGTFVENPFTYLLAQHQRREKERERLERERERNGYPPGWIPNPNFDQGVRGDDVPGWIPRVDIAAVPTDSRVQGPGSRVQAPGAAAQTPEVTVIVPTIVVPNMTTGPVLPHMNASPSPPVNERQYTPMIEPLKIYENHYSAAGGPSAVRNMSATPVSITNATPAATENATTNSTRQKRKFEDGMGRDGPQKTYYPNRTVSNHSETGRTASPQFPAQVEPRKMYETQVEPRKMYETAADYTPADYQRKTEPQKAYESVEPPKMYESTPQSRRSDTNQSRRNESSRTNDTRTGTRRSPQKRNNTRRGVSECLHCPAGNGDIPLFSPEQNDSATASSAAAVEASPVVEASSEAAVENRGGAVTDEGVSAVVVPMEEDHEKSAPERGEEDKFAAAVASKEQRQEYEDRVGESRFSPEQQGSEHFLSPRTSLDANRDSEDPYNMTRQNSIPHPVGSPEYVAALLMRVNSAEFKSPEVSPSGEGELTGPKAGHGHENAEDIVMGGMSEQSGDVSSSPAVEIPISIEKSVNIGSATAGTEKSVPKKIKENQPNKIKENQQSPDVQTDDHSPQASGCVKLNCFAMKMPSRRGRRSGARDHGKGGKKNSSGEQTDSTFSSGEATSGEATSGPLRGVKSQNTILSKSKHGIDDPERPRQLLHDSSMIPPTGGPNTNTASNKKPSDTTKTKTIINRSLKPIPSTYAGRQGVQIRLSHHSSKTGTERLEIEIMEDVITLSKKTFREEQVTELTGNGRRQVVYQHGRPLKVNKLLSEESVQIKNVETVLGIMGMGMV